MKTLSAIAGIVLLTSISFAQSNAIDSYTKDALLMGLDGERHLEALYKSAIAQFGNRTPFRNLVLSEIQHQSAFIRLMKTYGVPVPPNPYLGQKLTIPAVFSDACLEFAQMERLDAAKYKEIAGKVNVQSVARVFLQQAKVSEENHAVALERAAANNCDGTGICDGTGPKGNGPKNRNGQGNGKGRGKASIDEVQNCAMPLLQGNRNGVCDGTGPKGYGRGNSKGNGVCDGTGPKGNGPGYRKGQSNGQGKGQGNGQGRGGR